MGVCLLAAATAGCGADKGGGAASGIGGGATGRGGGTGTAGGSNFNFADAAIGGPGGGANGGNASGNGDGQCGQVIAILRDFKDDHPDMEGEVGGLQVGLVRDRLDRDGLPERSDLPSTQISGQDRFREWYRDTPGVNMRFELPLTLVEESPGTFVFDDGEFFPLDGRGFGNSGNDANGRRRNFHFTTEIRGRFKYMGGERFTFRGDDDVWAFVNGRLALDLGGVHAVETATIDFDARAAELGIQRGQVYSFDIFHAERHTRHSNFRMATTIDCLVFNID